MHRSESLGSLTTSSGEAVQRKRSWRGGGGNESGTAERGASERFREMRTPRCPEEDGK